jgi:hypothetical protein
MSGVFVRVVSGGCALLLTLAVVSCGGDSTLGASPTPVGTGSNVVAVTVDGGPAGLPNLAFNTLYTTVTVCAPGSTTVCQAVDNVQVDTGSYGLRLLASVLTISLPVAPATDGNSLVECTTFVDGYSWGPVAVADVRIGGEVASSAPVQVIGSTNFSTVPAACSGGQMPEDTVATFGANGLLGIGVFAQDCGAYCAGTADNGDYYSCAPTAACAPIAAPLTSQVLNPVPLFATDNNGTIIVLPTVAEAGATTVSGSLIFGIDTESNNASGSQTVLTLQPSTVAAPAIPGTFTTVYDAQSLSESFIDSGTNGLFFNDATIPACSSADFTGFYCPTSTLSLSATLSGVNGVSTAVNFSIGNTQTLTTNNPTYTAFPTIGGTYTSSTMTFDWGLPFFYGRRVANAIEGYTTSVGTGPYVAF